MQIDDDSAVILAVEAWLAAGGGRGGPTDVPHLLVAIRVDHHVSFAADADERRDWPPDAHRDRADRWERWEQEEDLLERAERRQGQRDRPAAEAAAAATGARGPPFGSRTPGGSPGEGRRRGADYPAPSFAGGGSPAASPRSMSPSGMVGAGMGACGHRDSRRRLTPHMVTDVSVASDGSILEPPSGSFDAVVAPGQSIQHAVDRVRPGGTVLLLPGLHLGPVVITREVRSRG